MNTNTERSKILDVCQVQFKDAYVAGGAVTSVYTNQPIADVDVYFKSEEAFKLGVQDAIENGLYLVDVSKRALTFVNGDSVVQLCRTGFYPTTQDIFDSFDFTCCMGALDLDTNEFTFHDDFFKHNAQRFLKFNPKTKYPIASMLRVIKYQQKGYTIGKGELLKIILACHEVELKSWDDVKEQIGGAYGHAVVLERSDEPFSIQAVIESLDFELVFNKTESNVPQQLWNEEYWETVLKHIGYDILTSPPRDPFA